MSVKVKRAFDYRDILVTAAANWAPLQKSLNINKRFVTCYVLCEIANEHWTVRKDDSSSFMLIDESSEAIQRQIHTWSRSLGYALPHLATYNQRQLYHTTLQKEVEETGRSAISRLAVQLNQSRHHKKDMLRRQS